MILDTLAQLVVILAGVGGMIATSIRYASRKFRESVRDELTNGLDEIRHNTRQLVPNGGSHLADEINRQGAALARLRDDLARHLLEHSRHDTPGNS